MEKYIKDKLCICFLFYHFWQKNEEPGIFRKFSTYFFAGQAGHYTIAVYPVCQAPTFHCLELKKYLLFPLSVRKLILVPNKLLPE